MTEPRSPSFPSLPPRVHRRAIVFASVLFVAFVAAVGLYAKYGYAVVLRVYEMQQIGRSQERVGSGKLVELQDYLRVDPANLRVRGLLVNQWIEFKDPARAREVARAGISEVSADQRPIAMLLMARAQIASGQLDDAAATYKDVLAAGESGEAHYGLAQIAAARGNANETQLEFGKLLQSVLLPSATGPTEIFGMSTTRTRMPANSTPDFIDRVWRALGSVRQDELVVRPPGATVVSVGVIGHAERPTDSKIIEIALDRIQVGVGDTGVAMLRNATDFEGAPPAALFWRGVDEENQGNRDAALDYYQRAAAAGDALGKFAMGRLLRVGPIAATTNISQ